MPPKIDQAAILILDVGKNVAPVDEKGKKNFFEEARECAARVIERKIMSQDKNYLGIILLGSKKTNNTKAEECDGAFKHIDCLAGLQTPTWKMIDNLPDTPSKSRGDWIDALIIAADHFVNGISGVKINRKKIILMTNFKSPTGLDESDVEQVINGFVDENFELDIIGPNLYDESNKSVDIQLAQKFLKSTNGTNATFTEAMQFLSFHQKKSVNPTPWNVDLSIGPNIKIPISSYIRLKDEPAVKKWYKAIKDPVTQTASSTEGIQSEKVHMKAENQEVVEKDSVIKGYHYGQQIIPFSECDKSLLYNSGEKSLLLYGFTKDSNINWQNLKGDGLSYVFGRKGDKKAQTAIRCLVECLHELKLAGIVRKVYNNGNAPKMYALLPVIDANNYICLSMAELCFKDDIKYIAFPPTNLKRYTCNDEQVNAFKDLIKAMDLTNAYDETYDDTEAFPIAETVSPSVQYVLDCIAYRAKNPGKPLPDPKDDIMLLFKTPPLVEKRSREPIEKLKKLFTLTKVEKTTRVKKTHSQNDDNNDITDQMPDVKPDNQGNDVDMPSVQLPVKTTNTITKIGTIDPINDFRIQVKQGKTLNDLSKEMTDAIENLVYCNLDGTFSKPLAAMKFYRDECVKTDPAPYNNWLQQFKSVLSNRNNEDIIELISENQLNFILKEENKLSTYENIDSCDTQLYENDTVPDATELTIDTEINDMFDDM